jgi:peptide/nickel transport system substrate-binding protein/oligopeptide transport system substrate-binding protein
MRSGKKFTLGFLPTLLALVAMLVAGCGGGGSTGPTGNHPTPAPKNQQIYRVALAGISDIKTFDPALSTDIESATAIDTVFTGMIQENDQLQVTPQMASSWDVSSDGLTYTFHLKPNLKFSDGTPLTATDVVYSIDRALSPELANQTGVTLTYLGLIKDAPARVKGTKPTLIGDSVNALDPNTVQLIVSKKTAYFLEALTYPTAYVVEKSVVTKWGAKFTDHLGDNGGQGGDGPFMVKTYSHSTGIVLVPNPNYYGKAQTLQEVDLNFYASVDTAYKAYQANQVDSTVVPPEQAAQAEKKVAEFKKAPSLSIFYVTMNYLYKPFDNIAIRQAFDLAVNKDIISKSIEHDLVTPTCHIVPAGMPGYNPNLQCPAGAPTKGDANKAKQLLATGMQQEGLTAATFPSITITYPSGASDTKDQITTMIQMWQSVLGITVKSHAEDFSALLTDTANSTCQTPATPQKCLQKGLQMWWLGWIADYPDPQDWTTLQFDNGAPSNNWNYGQNFSADAAQQVAVQQKLEQADVDLSSDRMSLYNAAEQQLVNDVVWIPLFQSDVVYMIKTYVQNDVGLLNAQNLRPPDDWANVYISAH